MSGYWEKGQMQQAGASPPQNIGQPGGGPDYAAEMAARRLVDLRSAALECAIRTKPHVDESAEETVRRARVFMDFISGDQA